MEFLSFSLNEALTIGLGVLFFFGFPYKLRVGGNKLKLPPGPRPWPLIGSLHLLGNLPHHSLTALAKKYGSIMFLRLGSVPTVVVSSPAMAKEFLKTHDLVFSTRPNCTLGKYVCYDHHNVSFAPYGAPWRQVRKLCTVELLTVKRIESFKFVREEEVSAMIASIWHESRRGANYLDLKKSLSSLTRNITCRMFATTTYSDSDLGGGHGFKQMVEEIFAVAGAFCVGDFVPYLDWFNFQGIHRSCRPFTRYSTDLANNITSQYQRDHLGMFKNLISKSSRLFAYGVFLLNQLNKLVPDMLAAGIETSSRTVEWAMSELLRNPATLARAQQEIESAIGRDRRVKESDVMGFEYLRCAVKETFRLHPPFPLLMEGCTVGRYFIPPKTRLYVNVWAIGRDENVCKDADQFKQGRFMGCNKDVKGQDFDLLPFGTGRRGCPGLSMGVSVVELALAQLLHCFDWTAEGEVDMAEEFGFTAPRKTPLLVRPSWRLTAEYPVYVTVV